MPLYQDLVPIKIKITRKASGGHLYPGFNGDAACVAAMSPHLDWSIYFDAEGSGWHYDRQSGLGEVCDGAHATHANTDPSTWYGCVLVPQAFANAAIAAFPTLVAAVDEDSFASFYDDRAHAHEVTEHLDADVLTAIETRIRLEQMQDDEAIEAGKKPGIAAPSEAIKAARAKCLDPAEQNYHGIRTNLRKTWASWKGTKGFTIHPTYRSP